MEKSGAHPGSLWFAAVILLPVSLHADRPRDDGAGRAVYDKCIACHSPERNRTGPMHCGVVGRKAGTVEGFEYSVAMRAADITWTAGTLDRFLAAPLAMIPGTSMGFAGLADARERRQLISWLATLTPSSEYCQSEPAPRARTRPT